MDVEALLELGAGEPAAALAGVHDLDAVSVEAPGDDEVLLVFGAVDDDDGGQHPGLREEQVLGRDDHAPRLEAVFHRHVLEVVDGGAVVVDLALAEDRRRVEGDAVGLEHRPQRRRGAALAGVADLGDVGDGELAGDLERGGIRRSGATQARAPRQEGRGPGGARGAAAAPLAAEDAAEAGEREDTDREPGGHGEDEIIP